MANGLNQRYKRDPVEILTAYWDINSASPQHGEGYGVDQNGIAYLDLQQYSDTTLSVKKAGAGVFSALVNESPIKAYYLESQVDTVKELALGKDCDYFFTDTITGCYFIAYGNNRHDLTVVHANGLYHGALACQAKADQVRTANYPISILFGPDRYREGLTRGDGPNAIITVIGWRKADGWHFYASRRVNAENRHYSAGFITTKVIEL